MYLEEGLNPRMRAELIDLIKQNPRVSVECGRSGRVEVIIKWDDEEIHRSCDQVWSRDE